MTNPILNIASLEHTHTTLTHRECKRLLPAHNFENTTLIFVTVTYRWMQANIIEIVLVYVAVNEINGRFC